MAVKISKNAAKYLRMSRPFIELAAEEVGAIDDNDTGTDDVLADILRFSSSAIGAALDGKPMPALPASLVQTGAGGSK